MRRISSGGRKQTNVYRTAIESHVRLLVLLSSVRERKPQKAIANVEKTGFLFWRSLFDFETSNLKFEILPLNSTCGTGDSNAEKWAFQRWRKAAARWLPREPVQNSKSAEIGQHFRTLSTHIAPFDSAQGAIRASWLSGVEAKLGLHN